MRILTAENDLATPFDTGELRARANVGQRIVEVRTTLAGAIAEQRDAVAHITTRYPDAV